jgi:hypothetical protein
MHTGRPINSALAILAKSIFWTQLHSLLSFDALFAGLFLWSCARILSLMAACMLFNERSSCRNYRSVELGAGRPTKQAKPLVVVLDPLSLRRSRVSSLYNVHSTARWGQHRCDGKRTTSTSQISSLSHLSPSFLIRFLPFSLHYEFSMTLAFDSWPLARLHLSWRRPIILASIAYFVTASFMSMYSISMQSHRQSMRDIILKIGGFGESYNTYTGDSRQGLKRNSSIA